MKRNMFDELKEGFDALGAEREGKVTLRQTSVEEKPTPHITADEVRSLRKQLHLSRSVFARYFLTNPRTVENWEQGRSHPNAQASLLIRLVEEYPDTVERLATI